MLVFTLAPPRIQYAVEFQMEIMFGLPLAVYALVRYLETQRARYLIAFLVTFWLQAIAVWYFAVILGSGLVVLALSYLLRHWSGWRWRTVLASTGGMVALGVALAPVAWPFFVTRAELGLRRDTGDAVGRSADVLSYVTTDGIWLEKLVRISHGHETSLFPGLVAYGLAGLAMAWLWIARRAGPARGWPERLVVLGIAASVLLGVLTVLGGGRVGLGSAWTRLPSLTSLGVALLGCLLLRDALAGWRRWRAGLASRRLTEGEWVSTLGAVGLLAWLLSLGPVVPVAGVATGTGLYAWLHPYVLPLQAIRGTTRFGLLVLLVLALLAGLGVAWLWTRWRGRARRLAVAAVLVALALDYVHTPAQYQWIASWTRPVDAVLRADPDDIAVLEWPLNRRAVDVDAMLRSVGHGKRVVNGFAGFALDFERELSGVLGASAPPFASPAARTALAQVYPLRYLLVRDPGRHSRPAGAALADLSAGFLRFRGSYGGDDLYEIVPLPERGHVLERWVSYDLLVTRSLLRARVQPLHSQMGVDQWVIVTLNGTPVAREPLDRVATLSAPLTAPLHRAAPNVIEIEHDYRRGPMARGPEHRIGTTGATSPVDALVLSGGQPHGDVASIRIGMGETSPNRRGYNVVALGSDGEFRGRAAFDTFADPAASARLGAWVEGLPAGTIVLGAVRDEASTRLGADAIQALATLGVRGDLRGRYRESHAFVGVKGAPPGSALEALGPRGVE
ncbi:MAG: interleukin-like EMT inducer domain-containing protein, partial [Candidatus Rokuibacteriota bacterium]